MHVHLQVCGWVGWCLCIVQVAAQLFNVCEARKSRFTMGVKSICHPDHSS